MTKSKTVNLNDSFLEKLLKETGGKFSLEQNIPTNPFLPSITDVIDGLGYNTTFSNISKLIEKEANQTLELSPSTRHNLHNKGVGRKSLNLLIDWSRRILTPTQIKKMLNINTSLSMLKLQITGTSSSEWLPLLESLKEGGDGQGLETIIPLLDQFIRNRCKAQDNHIRKARRDMKKKTFDPRNTQEAWCRMSQLWSGYSLISAAQLEHINDISKRTAASKEEKEIINNQAILATTCLEFDFYLEAIALLEVEILLQTKKASNKENNPFISIIGNSISAYASSELDKNTASIKSCLAGLLFNLIELLPNGDNKGTHHTGWRKLSSYIALEDQGSSESLADRQYNTIKGWRDGTAKNRPSVQAFNHFIENLAVSLDDPRVGSLEFAYRLLVMLDKLEARILDSTNDKIATKAKIKEVLTRYPIYYKECFYRHAYQ